MTDLSIGPEVEFDIKEYTFNELCLEITEHEIKQDIDVITVFKWYINGEEIDENLEDMLDLFLLFLGTNEVKKLVLR